MLCMSLHICARVGSNYVLLAYLTYTPDAPIGSKFHWFHRPSVEATSPELDSMPQGAAAKDKRKAFRAALLLGKTLPFKAPPTSPPPPGQQQPFAKSAEAVKAPPPKTAAVTTLPSEVPVAVPPFQGTPAPVRPTATKSTGAAPAKLQSTPAPAPPPALSKTAAQGEPQRTAKKGSGAPPAKWVPTTFFWADKQREPTMISHAAEIDITKQRFWELQKKAKTLCTDSLQIDVFPIIRGFTTVLLEVRGPVGEVREACNTLATTFGMSPVQLPPGLTPTVKKYNEEAKLKASSPAFYNNLLAERAAHAKRKQEEEAAAKAKRPRVTTATSNCASESQWNACQGR